MENYIHTSIDWYQLQRHLAQYIKIQLGTGLNIAMFEVQVFSSGNDVARGKPTKQSSTLKSFFANFAVDGNLGSFSHTDVGTSGIPVWWEVDLGSMLPIQSITVKNRWCGSNSSDPNGCLCRLSNATLSLIDSVGSIVAMQSVTDTCGKAEVLFDSFFVPPLAS